MASIKRTIAEQREKWVKLPVEMKGSLEPESKLVQQNPAKPQFAEQKESPAPVMETKALEARRGLARRSRRGRRVGQARMSRGGMIPRVPPVLMTSVVCNHTFRYRCTTAGTYNVSYGTLASALGGVCTVANTTIVAWASSIRLHRIVGWPPAGSGDMEIEISDANPLYDSYEDRTRDNTVPDGVTSPAPVTWRPKRDTLLGEWFTANTFSAGTSANILTIRAPTGAILDMTVSWTMANNVGGVSGGVTTASAGSIYYSALDGRTSNKLVPLGLPTTS